MTRKILRRTSKISRLTSEITSGFNGWGVIDMTTNTLLEWNLSSRQQARTEARLRRESNPQAARGQFKPVRLRAYLSS